MCIFMFINKRLWNIDRIIKYFILGFSVKICCLNNSGNVEDVCFVCLFCGLFMILN